MRPKKTAIEAYKKGKLGVKQLELLDYIKIPKERETFSQDWTAYNLAQTQEKILFFNLLDEILNYLPFAKSSVHRSKGRPSISLRDALFIAIIKIYLNTSSRRTVSELKLAKKAKYISHVPHFNTILNVLNDSYTEHLLKELVTMSSMPLKAVESQFAVDSTGFSTSVFERWLDVRAGSKSMKRKFKKCHAMVGTYTNIITSIEVTEGYNADSPQYANLVRKTADHFDVWEVSADKAYSSRKNLKITEDLGAIPFIPFKKNAIGDSKGYPIWRTMYEMFTKDNEKFIKHYHRRSNVESTFGMMKAKFSSSLRLRTNQGQINEVLCKAVCHNLVVLVHEIFELGIKIDFNKCAEDYFAQKKDY